MEFVCFFFLGTIILFYILYDFKFTTFITLLETGEMILISRIMHSSTIKLFLNNMYLNMGRGKRMYESGIPTWVGTKICFLVLVYNTVLSVKVNQCCSSSEISFMEQAATLAAKSFCILQRRDRFPPLARNRDPNKQKTHKLLQGMR
jgi:hypothetical protein